MAGARERVRRVPTFLSSDGVATLRMARSPPRALTRAA
jgi:hypothetical protein